jgi:alanyl-tRNA synthetase
VKPSYETQIIQVVSKKGREVRLRLGENRFHISGGGQPGDAGKLTAPGFTAKVLDCVREGEGPVVVAKVLEGEPAEGLSVSAEVDLARQGIFSRMHSGEHVLSRVLEGSHPGLEVYKVAVAEEETAVFMRWEGELDWGLLFAAESAANEVVRRDLPVSTSLYSPEEAQSIEGLKANWARLGEEPVRVVTIPGFDCIACSGTHVSSTGQIGGILVTGFRGTAPDWEVKFTVHRERFLEEYSKVARVLLRKVSCPLENLEKVYDRLQEEKQVLLRSVDKAKGLLSLPWEISQAGEKKLLVAVVPGLLPEMAVPALKRQVESDPTAVGLVLLPSGEGQGGSFILACGEEAGIDLRQILRDQPSLGAKGGGAPSWVNGVTSRAVSSSWIEFLKGKMS